MPSLLVVLACLCWAFDNHFTALIDGISAIQSTFVKGLFAGMINTGIGLYLSGNSIHFRFILYAIILGSFSYGVSIVLYIISAQKMGAIRSQIVFSSAPFWGVLFSVVLLSERVSLLQGVSFFLLIASIIFMIYDRHEHYHEHGEIEHTHFHRHDDMHHVHPHDDEAAYHEHLHRHEKIRHSHPHWPDIHHRHEHQ